MRRLLIQFAFFFLQNPFLKNFFTGRIYQGELKKICTPGLNCYSCPAAATSCPIGSLQMFFAGTRHSISLYVTGFLLALGVVFGKFICGYVCPMGLAQDLMYKIKTKKIILRLRYLRYVKYFILSLFVIVLPMLVVDGLTQQGRPWFCMYICPSGTLFGAIPIMAANDFLRDFIGANFIWKLSLAVAILASSVFVLRIFCRILCPLGAIYSMLNPVAIVNMKCDAEKCNSCKKCSSACHLKLEPMRKPNSPECFRCGKCISSCPQKALKTW